MPTNLLATEKNKKRTVPSPEVTKSDFTIGFRVLSVDSKISTLDFGKNVSVE